MGKTVAENIFPGMNPVGQSLRINRVPFVVIGLLQSKGQTPHGYDQDDTVMIPLSTAKKRVLGGRYLGGKVVEVIVVKAKSSEVVSQTEEQVKVLLRQRHRIASGQDDDFRVRNLAEMLNTQASSSEAMSILLMAVASVSLLVGGIGIMNIMLVSVTERTREIGLRMSVGATGLDIMTQFLIESVVLSLIGGLLGAIIGIGGSLIIANMGPVAGHHRPQIGDAGLRLLGGGGRVLRVLPGPQGQPFGPPSRPCVTSSEKRRGNSRRSCDEKPRSRSCVNPAFKYFALADHGSGKIGG